MPKTKLKDILKGGDDFQLRKIDDHIEEFNIMMEAITNEKELIKKRTKRKRK